MSVTVAEFAQQRGMSKQGVYNAIKRHHIPTYKGVSNGKSAQFMTDEDAEHLNELLGPTPESNIALAQTLQLEVANRENALLNEKQELTERLYKEKEAEMMVTRQEMLSKIDAGVSEMHQMVDELRAEYRHKEDHNVKLYKEKMAEKQAKIDKLQAIIDDLTYENTRLKDRLTATLERNTLLQNQLVEAQQHPWKNLRKSLKGDKKDGKLTEDTEK